MNGPGWSFDALLRPAADILQRGAEPPWQPLDADSQRDLLSLISPIAGRHHTGPRTQAARCLLPWTGAQLLRVLDPAWGDATFVAYFLVSGARHFLLDGSSAPLHDANEITPPLLTPDTVLDYLRFFCFFVHGEEGAFYLLERADHPLLDFPVDPATRQVLESAARAPRYEGPDAEGNFVCSAIVLYGAAVFEAKFAISGSGLIEMIDDEPIAAGLPVRLDVRLA